MTKEEGENDPAMTATSSSFKNALNFHEVFSETSEISPEFLLIFTKVCSFLFNFPLISFTLPCNFTCSSPSTILQLPLQPSTEFPPTSFSDFPLNFHLKTCFPSPPSSSALPSLQVPSHASSFTVRDSVASFGSLMIVFLFAVTQFPAAFPSLQFQRSPKFSQPKCSMYS
jgi:hypothetical protein